MSRTLPAAAWIDAHCHLADPRLDACRDSWLQDAQAAGIGEFIQGGVGPDDWDRQAALLRRPPGSPGRFHPVYGLHPVWVAEHGREAAEAALQALAGRLRAGRPTGLGEVGLDHRARIDASTHELQREFFERQLALPEGRDLPLVLHVVRAHEPALKVLEAARSHRTLGGIVHAYTGGWELARRYLDLGFSISVGGKLCFSTGFEKIRRAVVRIPADRLVLETDCPDQPPPAYEDRLNEPRSLLEVARTAAGLRGEKPEELLERSRDNLRRIFGLTDSSR